MSEGFEAWSPEDYDDDEPTIELESGETIRGIVLGVTEGEHDDGRSWYRLRVKDEERGTVRYFAHDQCKTAAREGAIEDGEPIEIVRAATETSFDDEDGEEVTYLPTYVGFPSGGD